MDDIVFEENINSGLWPKEFNGAWINIFTDEISSHTVICLYFDDTYESGTINNLGKLETLPNAYVSWDIEGYCCSLFVEEELRRKGIGTMLCAYARTYAFSQGVIFKAPRKMTETQMMLYQSIHEKYGEPYNNPDRLYNRMAYGYWGPRIVN